jgi:hypothetical protein
VRFEFFALVTILMMFFWVQAPCGLVGGSQRFGGACCLHLQGPGLHLQSTRRLNSNDHNRRRSNLAKWQILVTLHSAHSVFMGFRKINDYFLNINHSLQWRRIFYCSRN